MRLRNCFITGRLLVMTTSTITLPEAKLNIHKHLTEILISLVWNGEETPVTPDDKRDAEDLVSLIIEALSLEVVSTYSDGNIMCSINTTKKEV